MSNLDNSKTDNGIKEVLESIAEVAAVYGADQQRTISHIKTAEKFIKALRRADMEHVIGTKTITLNDIYGDDWRNNYGYNEQQVRDAANHLQRKQLRRLKEVLGGGDE